MKTWVRKTLSVGVLAAGALLFTTNGASADVGQFSIDNNGIGNGTQVAVPIQIPVNACGIGVGAVIGVGIGASGACLNGAVDNVNGVDHGKQHGKQAAKVGPKGDYKKEDARTESVTQVSAGNDGILNGTQAYVPIQVPVNACGIGVGAVIGVGAGLSGICANGAANDINGVDGHGKSGMKHDAPMVAPASGSHAPKKHAKKEDARTESATQVSAGNDGILNGTQLYAPIQVPVNACGIGVGAVVGVGLGFSGICANGAANDINESARTESVTQVSHGNDGILNGTQIYAPIQVPINVCGIGVGVLGVGAGFSGACINHAINDVNADESASTKQTEDLTQVSDDNDGILNGTQIAIPIQVPVNVCGIGVGVLGVGAGLSGACVNGAVNDVNGRDHDHGYMDHKSGSTKVAKTKNTKATKTEGLPVISNITQSNPMLAGAPLVGQGSTPVAGSVTRTARMNVGGVDPLALLGGLS
jgi:hypothetical protein